MQNSGHNRSDASPVEDELRLLRRCPLCNTEYRPDAVTEVARAEASELLHFSCESCKGSLLALFVRSSIGMGSMATMTDLSAGDALRLSDGHILTDDDVLSFHQLLTEHSQAFSRLFIS